MTDVVVVPGAPLLLPEYQGRTPADAGLVDDCAAVVRAAVATASHVVVVHATDREPRSTRPPVGLRVADHLLAASHLDFDVEHLAVAWDAPVADCVGAGRALSEEGAGSAEHPTTLLVVADGSARRTEKAPGHLDPRAAAVDDALVDAVRSCADGGLGRLLDLDPDLCADLLVAGRAPLQVLAAAAEGVPLAVESLEVSDPFGVLYLVAHLTRTP
ncbi:hypothetical protein ACOCJ4_14315 [Knoellia sp. CPCC 206435]|uniref:hypothetical protein n=1 Tax=Knoellia terrae TaxID=3404797 RepID=UPI003B42B5D3